MWKFVYSCFSCIHHCFFLDIILLSVISVFFPWSFLVSFLLVICKRSFSSSEGLATFSFQRNRRGEHYEYIMLLTMMWFSIKIFWWVVCSSQWGITKELKHRNISLRRRSIFRDCTGSRTSFLARIFNLSIARFTTIAA